MKESIFKRSWLGLDKWRKINRFSRIVFSKYKITITLSWKWKSIFKFRIIGWHWRFRMSLRDLDEVLIWLRPLGVVFMTTLLVALRSLLIFQNKSTHPGLDEKVFLVLCKYLSQMISNFYRDFILIYEFLIKITLRLYLL